MRPAGRRLFLPPQPVVHVTREIELELVGIVTALCGYRQPCWRAVILEGAIGTGKTALARAIAENPRVLRAFRDGLAWVDGAREPEEEVMRLCLGFGLERGPGERWLETWRRWSGAEERRMLLIIDNVRSARRMAWFVAGLGPQVVALVTTRKRLAVLAEVERWLPARTIRQVEVGELTPNEASRLARVVLGRELDDEDEALVQEIGERVRWRAEAIRRAIVVVREVRGQNRIGNTADHLESGLLLP